MAVGIEQLLEAGVHFGHQTRRWNPKMRRFIFAERGGIYIIDLKKTLRQMQRAEALVRSKIHAGDKVLFVCTNGPRIEPRANPRLLNDLNRAPVIQPRDNRPLLSLAHPRPRIPGARAYGGVCHDPVASADGRGHEDPTSSSGTSRLAPTRWPVSGSQAARRSEAACPVTGSR